MLMIAGLLSNAQSSSTNQSQMKYTVVIMYQVQPSFLQLSREKRNEVFEMEVGPILQKYAEKLHIRMFDSEAFHSKISDFIILECTDLKEYYFFMEHLRDTSLFGEPYIQLNEVVMGIEDGFAAFEETGE